MSAQRGGGGPGWRPSRGEKESQKSEKQGPGKKTVRLRCPGGRFQSGGRESNQCC